jgi:putative peptidoglycan lipid II flippase
MLLSKISGLIRDRVFAHYLGSTFAADAFRAALRIPNFLQNLFGEGVLSASFIPVYARLRAEHKDEDATKLAEAVFALLLLCSSVLVALGVLATPWLIDVIAPGFKGETRQLCITLVRIFFPGAGILVLSAWCLGILNSHRKFFLSYSASVMWNAAMIAAALWGGTHVDVSHLTVIIAWGSVVGSALQFGVQLPVVFQFLWPIRAHLAAEREHLRTVIRNFGPVFVSRGVAQISGYIDSMIASVVAEGAVAWLGYAQTLYMLPVGLFGMSVSAAELPAMSSALGSKEEIAAILRDRLSRGLQQIAYFVVPSAAAFLLLGDIVVATLYRTGRFGASDVMWVWRILAGSAVGLLASTSGRLYSSTFYALRDTRTPLRFAVIRITLTAVLGYVCAKPLPIWLGFDPRWGVAGLTISAGFAGWIEFALLRRALQKRIGAVPSHLGQILKLWAAAIVAAAIGFGIKLALPHLHPVLRGAAVLVPYGFAYLGITQLMGISTVSSALRSLRRR